MDHPDEFRHLPAAFAAAFLADSWRAARWRPDLAAFTTGHAAVADAIVALAHATSGALDAGGPARAQQRVAEFVKTGAAAVTYMRLHERDAPFADLPLRAMAVFLELVATKANLPRSYLEQHLPYPVIHAALMDIAMHRQTANDEKAHPFVATVFDLDAPKA